MTGNVLQMFGNSYNMQDDKKCISLMFAFGIFNLFVKIIFINVMHELQNKRLDQIV